MDELSINLGVRKDEAPVGEVQDQVSTLSFGCAPISWPELLKKDLQTSRLLLAP